MIHLRLEAKVWEEKLNPHVYNQRAPDELQQQPELPTETQSLIHTLSCVFPLVSVRVALGQKSDVKLNRDEKEEARCLAPQHLPSPATRKNDGFNSEYYWFKLFKTSVIKNIYKYELSTPLQNQRYVHTGHFLLLQFSDCFGWIFFSFLVTTLLLSSVKV